MKKIVFTACVAALTGVLSAGSTRTAQEIRSQYSALKDDEKTDFKFGITTDEWRILADEYLSIVVTNRIAADGIHPSARKEIMEVYGRYEAARALAAEYDQKFLDAGVDAFFANYSQVPLCAEAWINSPRNRKFVESNSYFIALARKYRDGRVSNYAFPERLNAAVDYFSRLRTGADVWKGSDLARWKKAISNVAARAIKRRIRERGRTFVVGDDGSNPVQDAVDALSSCLDAPRMSGTKEWVMEWFPEHEWHEPSWMSDEELRAYSDAVYFGDVDFSDARKAALCATLGVAAYNDFVNKYNGK